MKFISDQVYEVKHSHYVRVKGKKVRVIDAAVIKSIDTVPFKRRDKAAQVKSQENCYPIERYPCNHNT